MTGTNGVDPHPAVAPALGDVALPEPMHPLEQAICERLAGNPVEAGMAVLAVLDLHTCRPVGMWPYPTCGHCVSQECPEQWPCETVKAIADALGVTP